MSLKTMLLPMLTLSLEKEIIVLEKVWKKSFFKGLSFFSKTIVREYWST